MIDIAVAADIMIAPRRVVRDFFPQCARDGIEDFPQIIIVAVRYEVAGMDNPLRLLRGNVRHDFAVHGVSVPRVAIHHEPV